MTEYETFARSEAIRRGIDPDVSVTVWNAEGGLTEPARRGTFPTGSSWWAPQLHYGGAGYEYLGNVAGMGNSFTAITGWKPGDPSAWRDAMRYALDAVTRGGWTPWYGAKARGINGFDGVDRTRNWPGTPVDEWDYRRPKVIPYDPDAKVDSQIDNWSCAIQAVQFLLRSIGRNPDASDPSGDPWLRSQLVPGIVSPDVGLRVATGQQLAEWLNREYGGEMGWMAQFSPVSFDDVWAGAGVNPTIVGGVNFGNGGHWIGVRRRLADGSLEIANPAPGYDGITTTLSEAQWDARGPWHAIWLDRASTLPAPEPPPVVVPPPPPPPDPDALLRAEIRADLLAIIAKLDAAGVG